MIDQARVVAAAVSIDTSLLVEREEISVVAPHALVIVPAICFLVADSFPGILDDLLARSYAPFRKNTASLNFRAPNLVQSVWGLPVVT